MNESSEQDTQRSAVAVLLRQKKPKYWALALAILFFSAVSKLPYAVLLVFGKLFGTLIYLAGGRVRRIAYANITACYPTLSRQECKQRAFRSFKELGIATMETFRVWFGDAAAFYEPRTKLVGDAHWQSALDSGKGVILVSCHFGSLDLNATLAALHVRKSRKYAFTYRRPSDDLVNNFLVEKRSPYSDYFFPVSNLVGIIRLLKKGGVVWYAPDIEVKNKNSVFADFLGVPASTTAGLSKLAAAGDALILPFGHYRNPDNSYTLKFFEPLKNFPSGDPVADTRQINKAIEDIIEPYPERYWWAIKRFKNRPEGYTKLY